LTRMSVAVEKVSRVGMSSYCRREAGKAERRRAYTGRRHRLF
jgi:hypothetical protein